VQYIQKVIISAVIVGIVSLSGFAFASSEKAKTVSKSDKNIGKKADKKTFDIIHSAIKNIIPAAKLKPKDVRYSVLPNIFEVTAGPYIYYVTGDGSYLIDGSLLDLNTRKNITAPRAIAASMNALKAIGEENMIVFSPKKGKVKHTITVFTDLDCGYCRLMHKQIEQYTGLGIKVRYLLFPQAHPDSAKYKKAVSVWCSKNRAEALTRAKENKPVKAKTCDHPIAEYVQIGRAIGVSGTPSIIIAKGQVLPGFVAASELFKILEKRMAK